MLDSPPLPFAGVDNDETIKVSRSAGADPDGNQPGDLVYSSENAYEHIAKRSFLIMKT